jgi:hypothetical protein
MRLRPKIEAFNYFWKALESSFKPPSTEDLTASPRHCGRRLRRKGRHGRHLYRVKARWKIADAAAIVALIRPADRQMQPLTLMRRPTFTHALTFGAGGT